MKPENDRLFHMKTVLYVNGTEKFQDRQRLAGVTEYAQQHGWNLQSVEPLQSPKQAKELIRIWNPDGFIVCKGATLNQLPAKCFGNAPVLFSHNPILDKGAKENCIFNDSSATVEMAVKELLSLNLNGYAFVGWNKPTGWSIQRKLVFNSLMTMHGKQAHVFEPSERKCSPNTLSSKLAEWLSKLPRPLGVLGANDQIAHQIIRACHLIHLEVPEDVAVIGIDNDEELCESARPSISSIDVGFAASGQIAAEVLDRLMSSPGIAPLHVKFPPLCLVRRKSTRRFKRIDKDVSKAVEHIRREACNGISSRDITDDFDCSRRMAEIRFRNIIGHSILQEIRQVRLETAKRLLRNPGLGMNFIANNCGYSSPSAFSIFFHAETGQSPSSWRDSIGT